MQASSRTALSPDQFSADGPIGIARQVTYCLDRMPERRFPAILRPDFLKFDGCLTGAIFQILNVYAGPDGLTGPAPKRAPPTPLKRAILSFFPTAVHPAPAPARASRGYSVCQPIRGNPNQSEVIRGNPRYPSALSRETISAPFLHHFRPLFLRIVAHQALATNTDLHGAILRSLPLL